MLITNREKGLERIFSRKKTLSEGARKSVEDIIARVRADGDAAIAELTEKFDGIKLTPENMRLTKNDIAAAYEKVPADLLAALRRAKANIEIYHK